MFVQKNFFGMDVAYNEEIILNGELPFIMDLSGRPKGSCDRAGCEKLATKFRRGSPRVGSPVASPKMAGILVKL